MNADTAREKLLEFNQKGDASILVGLLGIAEHDVESAIRFINAHADKNQLETLVFQPLKVNEKHLVFVDPSLEIKAVSTDIVHLKKTLEQIKMYDNENPVSVTSSVDLRCLLLSLAKSELKSYDVFTNFNTDNLGKATLRKCLEDEKNWIKERVQIQKELINRSYRSAVALARKVARSKKLGRGIYCVRGSVASGKSSFIEGILRQNIRVFENSGGVLNTDALKRQLLVNTLNVTGHALSGYLFHEEASVISEKVLKLIKKSTSGYVVDRRMQDATDLDELLVDAAERKLPVTIFDLKVDFITSALRVLERTGVYPSDPTPDFLALYKSYRTIEEGRLSFLEKSLRAKSVKNYSVVRVNSNGHPVIVNLKKDYRVNKKSTEQESEVRYIASADSLRDTVLSNGKTLQHTLDEHSYKNYNMRYSRQEYLDSLLHNIEKTSRTFAGELNVSASKDKSRLVNLFMPKNDLADTTRNNITQAFDFVYENKNLPLISPQVLRDFIDQIARIVNQGIVSDENLILRSGSNSHKYFYVDTRYIERFYQSFVNQFFEKLNDPVITSVDLAAWVEWNIDFCGHIFVDGCGRIAKVVSAWLLMRDNSDLPDYSIGQDGFETVRESYRRRFALKARVRLQIPADTKSYRSFLAYYRRLFNPKETYKVLASGGLIYNSSGQFLILQTSKGKDYGKWVVPGGKLGVQETPVAAFVREVFEETGLKIDHIMLMGVRDYTAKSGNHYHFYDYTSTVVEEKEIRINEESLSFKWITKDQIPNYKFTDSIANFVNKYFALERLDIYSKVVTVPDKNFDSPYLDDHTMTVSLEKYVQSKLPVELITTKVKTIDRVEVHGIYPDLKVLNDLNLGFNILEVIHFSKQKSDNSNSLRPMFLLAEKDSKKLLVCCVTPGRDLLIHYASMLKYYFRNSSTPVLAYAYPFAEKKIDKWTGLDNKMIIKNDIVILGYSTFFRNQFEKDPDFSVLSTYQNKYYSATRFIAKNGKIVNCLEANYGHWGDISDFLAQKICQLHASEILHIGKVGTLKSPSEVYKRIYIPKSFVIGRRNEIMSIGSRISNSMEYIKEHSSLAHVSVSTTMEETFAQRKNLSQKKVDTIDIESSKIARAVALYNLANKAKVKFGAIHFSSDYLKKPDEVGNGADLDLATNREELEYRKKSILIEISSVIKKHLLKTSS